VKKGDLKAEFEFEWCC